MSVATPARLRFGRVIGLPVTVGRAEEVIGEILRLAADGHAGIVCVANVDMLTTARRDPELRRVLESAAIVAADGRPLSLLLRRRGFEDAEQLRGPDLIRRLCRGAARLGLPVHFYGGDAALADALAVTVARDFPGLAVAGIEAPPILPMKPPLDPSAAARIRATGARLVLVGLGCPKQEHWMAAHAPHLDAVLVGVGQAFGILAGQVAEAPPWMRRLGLEWLFRLAREPRRLWRRYLLGNARFVGYVLADSLAGRRSRVGGSGEPG